MHHYDQFSVAPVQKAPMTVKLPGHLRYGFLCGPLQLCCMESMFPVAGRKQQRGISVGKPTWMFHFILMKRVLTYQRPTSVTASNDIIKTFNHKTFFKFKFLRYMLPFRLMCNFFRI